jgi:cation diffusion facilitator family transporter
VEKDTKLSGSLTHNHRHGDGLLGWLGAIFHLHGHEHAEHDLQGDPAFATSEGIRTVWIALGTLAVTTILQIVVVALSSSVALLADTVHNLGDMLNSVPLLIAFYLSRRVATRRYTYGFGRSEDVAGVLIVLSIVFSAAFILWESIGKLVDPEPIHHVPWVVAAAIIGFVGNELVAIFQIRTGNRIGSASLVADGLHARIDGLTSLVVLVAVAGSVLGFPIVDPLVGILIGIAILFIARDASTRVWYRLMDAVDPQIVDQIEQYASEIHGVDRVERLRVRWVGHELHSEVGLLLTGEPAFVESQHIVATVRSLLLQHVRYLTVVTIEVVAPATDAPIATSSRTSAPDILPPRYQDPSVTVSAAPMGAVALAYDDKGNVAWDEMWTGFCELALAGGAPHRGTLLEPVNEAAIAANPERYAWVLDELERGLVQVTRLPVRRSSVPGWIGLECHDEEMALWLLRAIVVENVTVRREETVLWFPAGPDFRLEREIKNVVTVVAKTTHYWQEHIAGAEPEQRMIHAEADGTPWPWPLWRSARD